MTDGPLLALVLAQILTESDVFKVILNNGFMALFVVWVLFKGEPRYREMIDRMTTLHAETIAGLMRSHRDEMAARDKECREERKEIMATIAREGELNRESRNQFAHSLQAAIAEVYKGAARQDRAEAKKPPRPGSHDRPALPPTD